MRSLRRLTTLEMFFVIQSNHGWMSKEKLVFLLVAAWICFGGVLFSQLSIDFKDAVVIVTVWWCSSFKSVQEGHLNNKCPRKSLSKTSKTLIVGLHCQTIKNSLEAQFFMRLRFPAFHLILHHHICSYCNIDFEFKSIWLLLNWCSNVFPPHKHPDISLSSTWHIFIGRAIKNIHVISCHFDCDTTSDLQSPSRHQL